MPRPAMPEGLTATVYQFAVKGDLPAEALAEISRAHQLRNKLTEIELGYQEKVAGAWAAHPQIAAGLEREDAAAAQAQELAAQIKAARSRDRSARPDPGLTAELKEARVARREAREEVKALKERYYAAQIKPAILDAAEARGADLKATYGEATGEGLYWATYNDTADHHRASVARMKALRAAGQPAQVRFRRWTGEGTLAVQLQRQAGDGKWRNVATVSPWQDPDEFSAMPRHQRRAAAREGILRFRVGSEDHAAIVTVPVVLHRMIPAAADITGMRISRRVLAGKPSVSVSITVRVSKIPARTEGPLVAVHSGWRALPDGALRVAVAAGAGRPPANLAGAVRDQVVRDHGDWAEIVVPAGWRNIQARTEKIRGRRDTGMDALKGRLLAWLAGHPAAREDADPESTMAAWRSQARFAAIALRWRDQPPGGGAEITADLEAWRRQDKHLWQWEAHERDQLGRMRDEAWRRCAAWICASAAVVVMDEWDVAAVTRRPDVTEADDPQARAARANRVLASPGYLRSRIGSAARGRGVTVTEPPASVSPAAHYACGTLLDPEQRRRQVMVWCPRCERMVDQDWNALQHLLAVARGTS
jgi:hypothetical protein